MSRKKLALIITLIVSVTAIAGAVVYAQEASNPDAKVLMALLDGEEEASQDPQDRHFSFFLDGGAYLGVSTEDVSKENMARYGMRDVRGVGVTEVMKDSPAEKAGLRKDDVILRFDGESVTSVRKLTRLVSESSADQTVRLTISRGGAEQEVTATLSKRDFGGLLRGKINDDVWNGVNKDFKIEMGNLGDLGDGNWVFALGNRRIGISTQTLSKQLAEYFGVKDGGVLITSVTENSAAAKAGLKAGDVITAIDGEKVSSPGDITRALNKKETGDVSLTVIRDKNMRTVTLTPEKSEHPSIFKTGTIRNTRVVIPSIRVPDVNIKLPRIVVPSIDVTVPARPAKARTVII